MAEFYIIDVRQSFAGNPYITVWRPKNAGYAYPLSWAGRYSKEEVDQKSGYYYQIRFGTKRTLERFPVPCAVAEVLAIAPANGIIDGNAGPVLPNLAPIRAALRKARYIPGSAS